MHVTEGTNTKDQKKAFVEQVTRALGLILGKIQPTFGIATGSDRSYLPPRARFRYRASAATQFPRTGVSMAAIVPVSFVGAETGTYRVLRMDAVVGRPLTPVAALTSHPFHLPAAVAHGAAWVLRGTNSAVRYVERAETETLRLIQPPIGRPECTHAALIPIRKSDAWWNLAQDERREIFELRSNHIASCLKYLPAIARRLHQSRDLGEPFDFLTWFEYAEQHVDLFEELVQLLRTSEEWKYVDWEVDIRLVRDG